jgi:hypothetical protein
MINYDPQTFYDRYPHIKSRIDLLWGTESGRQLLNDLLTNKGRRDGDRHGFPPEDASYLYKLLEQHDKQFPKFDTANHKDIPFTTYSPYDSRQREKYIRKEESLGIFWWSIIVVFLILSIVVIYDFVKTQGS